MKTLANLLNFSFLPANPDAGLLVLRLWVGLSMLMLHGWVKLKAYPTLAASFPDPLHIGHKTSLILVLMAEVSGSVLILLGLFMRFAALVNIINLSVAFMLVHKASVEPGPGSGELALVYLSGYFTLLFAGAGKMSLDGK